MSAYNIVRVRVKPGHEEQFINAHRKTDRSGFVGFHGASIIKTGERSYCFIGDWDDFSSIEKSRDKMISTLDEVRDHLEDLGNGLGVTDPVSGEVVLELKP